MLRLTTLLGYILYWVTFIIEERLAVDAIIGTDFINRHSEVMMCRENIRLRKETISIVGFQSPLPYLCS